MPEEIEFNFKPTEALDYFRQRDENKISWSYTDVWEQEHKRSFTVAKMTQATLLDDVQKSLDKAIAEGQSYEQWRAEMLPRLDGCGLAELTAIYGMRCRRRSRLGTIRPRSPSVAGSYARVA